MKNSNEIVAAIEKYLADNGKNTIDLGKDISVNNSTITRWIHKNIEKRAKTIRNSHWKILQPKIQEELNKLKPSIHLSVDEALLLDSYRKFSNSEKQTAVQEFTVKAAVKEAKKTG